MRRVDDESANTMAYEVTTRWQFEPVPIKYELLGLDPEIPKEKLLLDAVTYAVRAGQQYKTQGQDSVPFIRLSTLIAFGVVFPAELIELHNRLQNRAKAAPSWAGE